MHRHFSPVLQGTCCSQGNTTWRWPTWPAEGEHPVSRGEIRCSSATTAGTRFVNFATVRNGQTRRMIWVRPDGITRCPSAQARLLAKADPPPLGKTLVAMGAYHQTAAPLRQYQDAPAAFFIHPCPNF